MLEALGNCAGGMWLAVGLYYWWFGELPWPLNELLGLTDEDRDD